MNRSATISLFILMLLSVGQAACDRNQPGKAAPIGNHAVLEQLATAYRSVAEEYPVQPSGMRPKGRKEFVERVFSMAGYDYRSTLIALAEQGTDVTNQDQRDLAELLFLPHRGLGDADMESLYTAEELAAIRKIQASLN